MTTGVGALLLVVVVVLAGGLTAVGLNSVSGSGTSSRSSTSTNCIPPTSAACRASSDVHDVSLLVPVQTSFIQSPVPFTANLPTGEVASSFTFNFGDGSAPVTVAGSANSATDDYAYASPGTYLVTVTANVNGATHDNLHDIGFLVVQTSYSVSAAEAIPAVSASITSNGTSSSSPTGVVATGATVSFAGSYTAVPVNPLYSETAPSLKVLSGPAGGATFTASAAGPSSATASIQFTIAGTYTVGFVANATGTPGPASQNTIFTIVVGSGGAAKVPPVSVAPSALDGTIISYTDTGGSGAETLDPAIDYETIGEEPTQNVYQNLVMYNQSSVTNFIPIGAACVPGSAQCSSLFGQSLVSGENVTFVISGASNFYDPNTHATWGVYPSDWVFSFARLASFAVLPSWGGNNGWVESQAFLPLGNASWDTAASPTGAALHYPGNNTPYQIFTHLLVNDSAFCPAKAYANGYHGCFTIVADGLGQTWSLSALYQLLSFPWAVATPAAWISQQGSPLPGWTDSGITGAGDYPIGLPGDLDTTNASSQNPAVWAWVNASEATPTMWDTMQIDGSGIFGFPAGSVTAKNVMAGSGPYYLAYFDNAVEYILEANPGYHPNPNCLGSSSCQPAVGKYVPKVIQNWENGYTPGEAALESGTADVATIASTQSSLLLQLLSQGKVKFTQFPSLSVYFYPFDWNYNLAAAQALTPTTITAPTDFFSSEAMRMLFTTAYPYQSVYNAILDVDGITTGVNYGGAIAPGFEYFPTNVSWPDTNPSATPTPDVPGTAWWWWAQVSTPGSPYYDAEIASDCTTSHPCTIPLFGETGFPQGDIQ
ncbi:MAG TPA: PKD domain-containing protein, partial [Thermoplasmata archaeon]|nr:PKD domain-containing protein [Thermoplasmata archaeon]